MQKNKLNILSTRPLSESIINEAAGQDVSIDCISFIETEAVTTPALKEKIGQLSEQKIIAVFTSMNAVEAVKEYVTSKPAWKVFSIGQTTKESIIDFFREDSIAGTADDAHSLADVIIQQHPKKVIFFCGDQRRDELPGKLCAKGIRVEEIIVYRTIAIPRTISKQYDGILFFSPSAVESFFTKNTITENVIVFAIGTTTAKAIQQHVSNPIVIADKPGKEELVKKMLTYFSTEKHRINE